MDLSPQYTTKMIPWLLHTLSKEKREKLVSILTVVLPGNYFKNYCSTILEKVLKFDVWGECNYLVENCSTPALRSASSSSLQLLKSSSASRLYPHVVTSKSEGTVTNLDAIVVNRA
jgi:hypothetical protein